jgi:hypothetical protein
LKPIHPVVAFSFMNVRICLNIHVTHSSQVL